MVLVKAIPQPDYHIKLWFDTGEVRILDFRPYLSQTPWQNLADRHDFHHLHLEAGTIHWLSGEDFCADVAYQESRPPDPTE